MNHTLEKEISILIICHPTRFHPFIIIFHLLLVVVGVVIEVVIVVAAAFVVFEIIAVWTGVALNDVGVNDVTAVPKRSQYL